MAETKDKPERADDRIDTATAAEILGVSTATVRAYVAEGWLHGSTPSGERGRGKHLYFERGEVWAFKRGNAPGAKAYREQRDYREERAAGRRGRGKVVSR